MSNFKELVRIGKDAEARYTSTGKAITRFSAAYDNGWGDNKQTVWLDCSIWGDRGEKLADKLTKGSQIVVSGDIGTREYEGKTYVTLNVQDVKLIGGTKSSDKANSQSQKQPKQNTSVADASNGDPYGDDIPFSPIKKRSYL